MNKVEREQFDAGVQTILDIIKPDEQECNVAVGKRTIELGVMYSLFLYHSLNGDKLDDDELGNVLVSIAQTIYSLGYLDAKRKYAI